MIVLDILLIIVLIIIVGGFTVYITPTEKMKEQIKEWLLYAVTVAEKELGSGTGQIKLRYVYNMFIEHFTFISKIISFGLFSSLVDEVLITFKNLVDSNINLSDYVYTTKSGE